MGADQHTSEAEVASCRRQSSEGRNESRRDTERRYAAVPLTWTVSKTGLARIPIHYEGGDASSSLNGRPK